MMKAILLCIQSTNLKKITSSSTIPMHMQKILNQFSVKLFSSCPKISPSLCRKCHAPLVAALLAALPRPCSPWTLRGPERRALERPRTCPDVPLASCFKSRKVFAFLRIHGSPQSGPQSLIMVPASFTLLGKLGG